MSSFVKERTNGTSTAAWRSDGALDRVLSIPKFRSMKASAGAPGCPDVAVHSHCFDGKESELKDDLDNGKDPNGDKLFDAYSPPIHIACARGHYGCVELLLERGARIGPDRSTRGGRHPAHLAALFDRREVLVKLIEAGADVNATDHAGASVLNTAAAAGSIAAVKVLLENSKPSNPLDTRKRSTHSGELPLHAACRNGHSQIVKMLIDFELRRCSPEELDKVIKRLTSPLEKGSLYTRPSQVARSQGNIACAKSIEDVVRECTEKLYGADLAAATTSGYKSRRATSQLNETQFVSHREKTRAIDGKDSYDPSMGGGMAYRKCTKCERTAKDLHGARANATHSTAQHAAWLALYKVARRSRYESILHT